MSISLMKVLDQIGEIAREQKEEFYRLNVEVTHIHKGDAVVTFKGYINGSNWVTGNTPEEVLDKLKSYYGMPSFRVINDIIIPEP